MLNIEKKTDGSSVNIALEGRLDTMTSPQLEETLKDSLDGVTSLIMDFEKKFDIEIPDDDAGDKISTVGDAIKYIEDKVNEK